MSRPAAVFALYKGDRFIDLGTANELSARHGVHPSVVYKAFRDCKKQTVKNGLLAVRIDDERLQ